MDGGSLRLSDADRERAVADLKTHAAAGRLSMEELPERVAAAYAAETFGELADLMHDLPVAHDETVPAPVRRSPIWPGLAPFTEVVELPVPRERIHGLVLERLAPSLASHGYDLVDVEDDRLDFQLHQRVLLLFHHRRFDVRIALTDLGGGRTRLVASGSAPRDVRRAFAGLRD